MLSKLRAVSSMSSREILRICKVKISSLESKLGKPRRLKIIALAIVLVNNNSRPITIIKAINTTLKNICTTKQLIMVTIMIKVKTKDIELVIKSSYELWAIKINNFVD